MNSNWKQRYNQAEDTRVGKEMDQLIELGIRLACVAFNETKGLGAGSIEDARKKIQEYIDREFNGGAPRFSTARRLNVERGIERVNAAYEKIMSKKRVKRREKESVKTETPV